MTLCLENDSKIEKDTGVGNKAILMSYKNHSGEARRVILIKIMQGSFILVEFIVRLIIMLI